MLFQIFKYKEETGFEIHMSADTEHYAESYLNEVKRGCIISYEVGGSIEIYKVKDCPSPEINHQFEIPKLIK